MEPVPAPILPASWAAILDNVQHALAQAEAEATESASKLNGLAPDWADDVWQKKLGELRERARPLEACAARADLAVAAVETALQASETALRQWLEHVEAIRRSLANLPGGSV